MKIEINPQHLNILQFAGAGARWSGEERLLRFVRLMEAVQGVGAESMVTMAAQGEMRTNSTGVDEAWLHLVAKATLVLTCQRCLGPMDVDVHFERNFRFVATEELAEQEDEAAEEDVLVLSKSFNLLELVEDELLMEQPLSPKHGTCPGSVRFSAIDPGFVEAATEKANPFAVLSVLQKRSRE